MTNYTLTNLKEYKENQYEIKLKDHLEKYIDYDELHFIESELIFFKNCYDTANIKMQQNHYDEYNHKEEFNQRVTRWEYGVDSFEILASGVNDIVYTEIVDFNEFTNGFNLVIAERLAFTYSKIISFLNDKKEQITKQPQQIETAPENSLNWQGKPTEFIELIKALIENGNIKGTQTEIISKLSNVFNIKINNENKLINDIKTRNNGSETLFIDRLQKSLFDYITQEKKK